MKKTSLIISFLILFNIFFTSQCFSKSFALKLKDNNGICASAFLTNKGKIITAAHTLSNCKNNVCENLIFFKDDIYFPITNIKIEKISYALDVAILSYDTINKDNSLEGYNTNEISTKNKNLKIIGFPNCGKEKSSKGNVYIDTTIQSFITSKTNYGNSGSVVLDKDLKFYGLAIKASDTTSAILSLFLGKNFNTTILKAEIINKISSLPQSKIIEYELEILKKQYYENIMNLFTKDRLNLTTHFLLMIDNLVSNLSLNDIDEENYIRKILDTRQNAPFLLKNISYKRNLSPSEENAEIISLIYYMEKHGLMNTNLKKINIDNLFSSLSSPYRSEKHKEEIKKLLSYFESNIKDNYLFSLVARVSWYLLLASVLIIFNIFATGYIYRATKENKKLIRIIKSIFYPLIFWIFSIIIFNYLEKKREKKQ